MMEIVLSQVAWATVARNEPWSAMGSAAGERRRDQRVNMAELLAAEDTDVSHTSRWGPKIELKEEGIHQETTTPNERWRRPLLWVRENVVKIIRADSAIRPERSV